MRHGPLRYQSAAFIAHVKRTVPLPVVRAFLAGVIVRLTIIQGSDEGWCAPEERPRAPTTAALLAFCEEVAEAAATGAWRYNVSLSHVLDRILAAGIGVLTATTAS